MRLLAPTAAHQIDRNRPSVVSRLESGRLRSSVVLEQHEEDVLVVEPFAVPPAGGGALVDGETHRLMLAGELDDVSAETSLEAGGAAFEEDAVGVAEDQLAALVRETRAALVDQAVVAAAEQYQIVQFGLAAVGPVPDVVGVHPVGVGTGSRRRGS